MEADWLNQLTRLIVSLVVVLQITPWVLILVGIMIIQWLDRHGARKR